MLIERFWALWNAPRHQDPPPTGRWDYVLIVVLGCSALVEATQRSDLPLRPLALVTGLVVVQSLAWRRSNPPLAVAVGFGAQALLDATTLVTNHGSAMLFTSACLVIIPYSLGRWGSGREVLIGMAAILLGHTLRAVAEADSGFDAVSQSLFWLFPALVGVSIRMQAEGHKRKEDDIRMEERERLARDLHDTIGHHVAAIAIQAEAGLSLVTPDAPGVNRCLELITAEASQTLKEMRHVVGALRTSEDPELGPQRRIRDIGMLANGTGEGPTVTVEVPADLGDVIHSVETTLYRVAQESVTNALRHSTNPDNIHVRVIDQGSRIKLTVCDDGQQPSVPSTTPPGHGLIGMQERIQLVGGTLMAGYIPAGGWTVEAVVPKQTALA